MAFFKFRTSHGPGKDASASAVPPPAQSIDAIRRRARHRLIGAALLVLLGVVGFPLLFDSQPRPVVVDIPIDIPDKTKVKPLVLGTAPVLDASASAAAPAVAGSTTATVPASAPVPAPSAAPVAAAPAAAPAPAPAAAPTPAPVVAAAPPSAAPAAKPDAQEAAKANALLEGKDAAAKAERYVVQVGAYSEAAKLREVRQKLEKAGLKTYTQVVDTKDGKRTRVRVGPFASTAEADKAAAHIKRLDLPAAVLKM